MTGVFACACERAFPTKAAASGLKQLAGAGRVEIVEDLCSAAGREAMVGKIREHGIDRIVLAGCPVLEQVGMAATIAEEAGLPAPHVVFLPFKGKGLDAAAAAPRHPQGSVRPRGDARLRDPTLEALRRKCW